MRSLSVVRADTDVGERQWNRLGASIHTLSPVAAFNAAAEPDRYATIGRLLDRSDDAAAAIDRLRRDIGISDGLAAWQVGEGDLGELAEMALRSDNVQANPRAADRRQLIAIQRSALEP